MGDNTFGKYIRARRTFLGLTQEQLAELINDASTQSDVSRLERGHTGMPHRARMEELAAALDVSLGALLIGSGWLTEGEGEEVDEGSGVQQRRAQRDTDALLVELAAVQIALQLVMDRVAAIEQALRSAEDADREDPEQPPATDETPPEARGEDITVRRREGR